MSDDALASWEPPKRKTRGGQASYTDLAIETCLTLGCVYNLPLRQTEGFVRSILGLLGRSDLASPDHSTLVRRRRTTPVALNAEGRKAPVVLVIDSTGLKFYGPGEWDRFKHGEKRRAWRKLHIAADAGTGEILSFELTDSDTSDGAMAGQLVAEAGGSVAKVICDGAYANPAMDDLLVRGQTTFDRDEREAIYDEVQQIIATDVPLIPVFHVSQAVVARAGLTGYQVHPTETYWITHETRFTE